MIVADDAIKRGPGVPLHGARKKGQHMIGETRTTKWDRSSRRSFRALSVSLPVNGLFPFPSHVQVDKPGGTGDGGGEGRGEGRTVA